MLWDLIVYAELPNSLGFHGTIGFSHLISILAYLAKHVFALVFTAGQGDADLDIEEIKVIPCHMQNTSW